MKIKEKALFFLILINKVRRKGKENEYKDLSMAEHLLPENRLLSIEEKQRLFEVKHRMTRIPSNFPQNRLNKSMLLWWRRKYGTYVQL